MTVKNEPSDGANLEGVRLIFLVKSDCLNYGISLVIILERFLIEGSLENISR